MAVLLACLALAVTAWAGDPWKEKTYKEWNEAEVNRILADSPWSRPVTVPAFWRSGGSSMATAGGRSGGSSEAGEGGGAVSQGGAGASGAGGGGLPEAHFTVRWGSARTTREALARLAILRGMSEADAEKLINLPATEHQIVVYGSDMAPFAKSDEKSLMEKTFIKFKKNKQKISPSRVEIKRAQDGKKISGIVFYFPMKSEAGEPVIASDEKGVDFECRTDAVSIRQSFEPQKMISKAGPDLR